MVAVDRQSGNLLHGMARRASRKLGQAVQGLVELLGLTEAQEAWVRLPAQIRRHVVVQADPGTLAQLGYTMPDAGALTSA